MAHHVDQESLEGVRTALSAWFEREEVDADEPFRFFGDDAEKWLEKAPADRTKAFSSVEVRWQRGWVEALFEAAVSGIEARVHVLEHLPVAIVVVRFELRVWTGGEHDNTVKQLEPYMEHAQQLVEGLLGASVQGLGQVIAATSETRPREQLDELRRQVRLLRDAQRDGRDPPLEELTSPDLQELPPGRGGGGHGFSHLLGPANLHTKVVPTQGVGLHGNKWIIALYEWGDPGEESGYAPHALSMVNPILYARPTEGYKDRATGMIVLQVMWHWLRFQVPKLRNLEVEIQKQGKRLRWQPLGVLNMRAWMRLHALETRVRGILYGLRTVREEYRFGIEEFLRIQRGKARREVPIPPGGLEDPLETEHPDEGVLTQFVAGYQRDLDHALSAAENVWESAQAEKTDFATRIQMAVAVTLLILTIVLLGIAIFDYQLAKQALQNAASGTSHPGGWLLGVPPPSSSSSKIGH